MEKGVRATTNEMLDNQHRKGEWQVTMSGSHLRVGVSMKIPSHYIPSKLVARAHRSRARNARARTYVRTYTAGLTFDPAHSATRPR
jgi:hypothetical protein